MANLPGWFLLLRTVYNPSHTPDKTCTALQSMPSSCNKVLNPGITRFSAQLPDSKKLHVFGQRTPFQPATTQPDQSSIVASNFRCCGVDYTALLLRGPGVARDLFP